MLNHEKFPNQNLENLKDLESNKNSTETKLDGILEYLKEKHEKLVKDYGNHSCSHIAHQIAEMLINCGKKPELLNIEGSNKKVECIEDNLVEPKIYNGEIQWGNHIVCACEGIVYDPMVGEPLFLQDYLKTVFIKPVSASIEIPYNDLVDNKKTV